MSFNSLHPDTWAKVVDYLKVPVPSPLSGCITDIIADETATRIHRVLDGDKVGQVSRRDIRQGDLATLMRTSIIFNSLAAPILYLTVVTDDFVGFTNGLGQPSAHTLIKSKQELLGYTRKLYLEYSKKGDAPTYTDCMCDRLHWSVVGETSQLEIGALQTYLEVRSINDRLLDLKALAEAGSTPFSKLETLAIASIFGSQYKFWDTWVTWGKWQGIERVEWLLRGSLIRQCQWSFLEVIQHSPIVHLCQRGSSGPLSMPMLFYWENDRRPAPLFTVHKDNRGCMPAALGSRTCWVLDPPAYNECILTAIKDIDYELRDKAQRQCDWRKSTSDDPTGRDRDVRLLIDVFASGNRLTNRDIHPALADLYPGDAMALDPENEEVLVSSRRRILNGRISYECSKKDGELTWRTAGESPACAACAWTFVREAYEEEAEEARAAFVTDRVHQTGAGIFAVSTWIDTSEEVE